MSHNYLQSPIVSPRIKCFCTSVTKMKAGTRAVTVSDEYKEVRRLAKGNTSLHLAIKACKGSSVSGYRAGANFHCFGSCSHAARISFSASGEIGAVAETFLRVAGGG